ncbi:GNAT family N-acetyltransferase [Roseovarius atlanticus]|uniref:GNAT family N-acetyltransferase n=1 Tax=Roseovarius atlanticus TaxID=1641875 RepID=UPI001C937D36|nr:GNAT family N-acetyltransferase [Roseovarius atlanticus]MBY5987963.1 GNAT family N-acetyltransferase [Roseovarius atlanticus]MBY6123354.1 GNAT family N-acetyltransferase [Roseovarius atlanticus]MBY6147849.1 GNAT family N-acetyltransferase [Roseovarius atlanticus]
MKIFECDPDHPDAKCVLSRLSETLLEAVGDTGQSSFDADDVRQTRSAFFVGYDDDIPIACGALRPISEGIVELKRMYAEKGLGSLLLSALEEHATSLGYSRVWLSTRVANHKAVHFYKKHNYKQLANYGKYAGRNNSICFEKILS